MINKALYSSASEDWSTPQHVFDKLNNEFHFTLDAAASPENAKVKNYIGKEENALTANWLERAAKRPYSLGDNVPIFLNPPYGRSIGQWMKKASEEGRMCTVVCLVHARTDTKWWHSYAMLADEIRFVKGRLRFGDSKNSAPFPSAIVIYRPESERTHNFNVPIIKSVIFKGIA